MKKLPLYLVNQDVSKMDCEAIIEASNTYGYAGDISVGEAKILLFHKNKKKFHIFTLAPSWDGGDNNERELLKNCYKNSLALACENGCEKVAINLIYGRLEGFPYNELRSLATEAICEFLQDHDAEVYLGTTQSSIHPYDKAEIKPLLEYINNSLAENKIEESRKLFEEPRGVAFDFGHAKYGRELCNMPENEEFDIGDDLFIDSDLDVDYCESSEEDDSEGVYYSVPCAPQEPLSDIKKLIASLDDSFAVTLLKLMDIKKVDEVECYKKANVSKQTWYKIMNVKDYRPNKTTVLGFAIALKLSFVETQTLLASVGFTLAKNNKFDIIITYCLENEIYNVFKINELLYAFDQPCLGV